MVSYTHLIINLKITGSSAVKGKYCGITHVAATRENQDEIWEMNSDKCDKSHKKFPFDLIIPAQTTKKFKI